MDTPTPSDLSLDEVEMRRTTKRPQMLGLKATRCGVEKIKKIRVYFGLDLDSTQGCPFRNASPKGWLSNGYYPVLVNSDPTVPGYFPDCYNITE